MGGVSCLMRYTEKDYRFEFSSPVEWIQNILGIICIAPLRLCNEISSKIVYLSRNLIEKIIFLSVILQIVITVITAFLQSYFSELSANEGKIPILLLLIVLAFTCLAFCFFKFYDISIYAQLNQILPIVGDVSFNESVNEQPDIDLSYMNLQGDSESNGAETTQVPNTPLTIEDLDSIELDPDMLNRSEEVIDGYGPDRIINPFIDEEKPKPQRKDASVELSDLGISDELEELVNLDLVEDEDVINYQHSVDDIPEIIDQPVIANMEIVEDQMEKASSENRYIPEKNLTGFLREIGADTFSLFDSVESWAVVDSLTD